MIKLLSTISLILAIALFPPAALALVSNNAVPGDVTYPIKRTLEDGIFAIASLNPTTKAWFAAARSDRRFKEFTTLVTQGKKGEETLNELVEQTQVAANQIAQVNDEGQKQKLVQQLSESIKKYDQGLAQISVPAPVPVALTTPQPTPQSTPAPTIVPVSTSTPISTPHPTPTSSPIPTQPPTPRPTLSPVVTPPADDKQKQIDEARKQLEEIRRRLAEEQRERSQNHSNSVPQIRQESDDKREDKKETKQEKENSKDKSKKNKD